MKHSEQQHFIKSDNLNHEMLLNWTSSRKKERKKRAFDVWTLAINLLLRDAGPCTGVFVFLLFFKVKCTYNDSLTAAYSNTNEGAWWRNSFFCVCTVISKTPPPSTALVLNSARLPRQARPNKRSTQGVWRFLKKKSRSWVSHGGKCCCCCCCVRESHDQ